jgi:TniQ
MEDRLMLSPRHSRLYSTVVPIAPASAWGRLGECLTSYLCRLAAAHRFHVGTLIAHEISPTLDGAWFRFASDRGLDSFFQDAGEVNGLGAMARQWCHALMSLCERSDLNQLTLLAWADALPARKLHRRRQAWCAQCFAEWRAVDEPLYLPLLWTLDVVTVCPAHGCALVTRCPYRDCGAQLRWLGWRTHPGWCNRCGRWLGAIGPDGAGRMRDDCHSAQDGEESALAALAVEALAWSRNGGASPPRGGVARGLSRLIEERADGNISAFARQMAVPKVTLWGWATGRTRPEFGALLQLCRQAGVAPSSLLYGWVVNTPVTIETLRRRAGTGEPKRRSSRRQARRFEIEEMRRELSAELSMRW